MSNTLAITPAGQLQVVPAAEGEAGLAAASLAALEEAFAESTGSGLLLLASRALADGLPAECQFWRAFGLRLFQAACQLGEVAATRWKELKPPPTESLQDLVESAPPMRGLEYLTAELLEEIWLELRAAAIAKAQSATGGPAALLQEINPLWHLLGRVTFHLAENKRDADRPFAFLATFTHRMSGQTKLSHLPLAEALRRYAGAGDRAKLEALLEPVKRAADRSMLIRELLESKALFSPQAWTIRQAHRFLTDLAHIEQSGVVVRVPDWWSARRPPRPQVQVSIGERPAASLGLDSMLEFQVNLAIDGEPLTDEERERLLAGGEGLALLRGKWVEIDRQRLEQALDHWKLVAAERPDGIGFIEGMRMLAGVSIEKDAAGAEATAWTTVRAGDWLRHTLEQLRSPAADEQCQPGRDLNATLRPYQVEGVRWLWLLTRLRLGACLADDMGLGKTIQIIDLLLQQKRAAGAVPAAPSLLVVPASLLGNWRQELQRFGPALRVLFVHRSETDGEALDRIATDPRQALSGQDLVVTTYGLARRQDWLAQVPWSLIVLDEAQAIENPSSAQARCVKKLQAPARIALSGTPVENHLGDLWSLLDFCCPGLLGTAAQFKQFVKRLNQSPDPRAFSALRKLVRPYILRRLKTDPAIAPDLPAKTEMRADCGLSKKQAVLYEHAVSELARRLERTEGIARRGLVLATLMQLKQICNHPAQYLKTGSFPAADSGKFDRLKLLCEPIGERQERALVFTQFQSLTEPLAKYLATVFGRTGLVLDGRTPIRKRTELVREFQSAGGPPFLVVSLKAGGSGLNLTAASHVIHFDRWWNPAVENQATDRAFRIGQRRNVLVHKFVCRGTVEERIDEMIAGKQALADRILNQEAETQLTEMTNDQLLQFVSLDITRATME